MWHFQDSFTLYSTGNVKIIYVSYFFEVRYHVFKKSLFQFFSTWKFFKIQLLRIFTTFFSSKTCLDLNYSMYECFCLTDNDFVLFQQTSRTKVNSMYLDTTGAQKGAEVRVCYMHFFIFFFFRNFKNSHFKNSFYLCVLVAVFFERHNNLLKTMYKHCTNFRFIKLCFGD